MTADGNENMTPLFSSKTKLVLNLDMEFVFHPWKLIERCELILLFSDFRMPVLAQATPVSSPLYPHPIPPGDNGSRSSN